MKPAELPSKAGLTQKQLEDAPGIKFQYISRLERKEREIGKISLSVAARLAKALGVYAEELLDEGDAVET